MNFWHEIIIDVQRQKLYFPEKLYEIGNINDYADIESSCLVNSIVVRYFLKDRSLYVLTYVIHDENVRASV